MRLDLIAGRNGAGKSTLVRLILQPQRPHVPFVNADVIAEQRWPDDPTGHALDAATIAEQTRDQLLDAREPLIAETVFSHPSKLDLIDRAQQRGFTVVLHVLLVPEDLAVARVAQRASDRGHDVPEQTVRRRYRRLWPLVATAMARADLAYVWNNATVDGPELVAELVDGIPAVAPVWPTWTPAALTGAFGEQP